MGIVSLRLPPSLHESAREVAKQESISVNQLITLALAEKIAALRAVEELGRRAERGDRRKFAAALAKVADVEPEEHDRR